MQILKINSIHSNYFISIILLTFFDGILFLASCKLSLKDFPILTSFKTSLNSKAMLLSTAAQVFSKHLFKLLSVCKLKTNISKKKSI